MVKKLSVPILCAVFIFGFAHVCRAGSFSASYKITVRIPAIVGVNVPDTLSLQAEKKNKDWTTTTTQKIKEDGGKIVYQTIVLK